MTVVLAAGISSGFAELIYSKIAVSKTDLIDSISRVDTLDGHYAYFLPHELKGSSI